MSGGPTGGISEEITKATSVNIDYLHLPWPILKLGLERFFTDTHLSHTVSNGSYTQV